MSYHTDARCGSCGGPLEVDRDAICHKCVPQGAWFEAWLDAGIVRADARRYRRRRLFWGLFMALAAALGAVMVWGWG